MRACVWAEEMGAMCVSGEVGAGGTNAVVDAIRAVVDGVDVVDNGVVPGMGLLLLWCGFWKGCPTRGAAAHAQQLQTFLLAAVGAPSSSTTWMVVVFWLTPLLEPSGPSALLRLTNL